MHKSQRKQQVSTKAVPYEKIEKLYYLHHDESIATFSGEVEAYDIEQFVVHEINEIGGYDAYLKSLYFNDDISMQLLIELSEPVDASNECKVSVDEIRNAYIEPHQVKAADELIISTNDKREYELNLVENQSFAHKNRLMRMQEDFRLLEKLESGAKQNLALEAFVYKWIYSYEDKIAACRSYQLFLENAIKASLKRLSDLKSLSIKLFGIVEVNKMSQHDMIDRILNYDFNHIYLNDDGYNDSVFYAFIQDNPQHQNIISDLKQYFLLKKLQAQPDRRSFNRTLQTHHPVFTAASVQPTSQPNSEASRQKKQKLSEFIKETGLFLLGAYAVMMVVTPIIFLGGSVCLAIKHGLDFFNSLPSHRARKKKQNEFLNVAQQGVDVSTDGVRHRLF